MEQFLLFFWDRLSSVKTFTRHEISKNLLGKGKVSLEKKGPHTLLFKERGTWENQVEFSNSFCFSLKPSSISLAHLRYEKPVFLLEFIYKEKDVLVAKEPYLCGEDVYFATLKIENNVLVLNWRVSGPKKNEEIQCSYF